MAADIIVFGYDPPSLAAEALGVGFAFVKPYRIHVHVDVRSELR